jgi:hypothetical protein
VQVQVCLVRFVAALRIFKKRPSAQRLVRALISLKSRDAMKENLDSRAGSEFDIEVCLVRFVAALRHSSLYFDIKLTACT